MSLLDRIYYEASAEERLLPLEESLSGLYRRIPEAKEDNDRIWKVLDESSLNDEQKAQIFHNWEFSRIDEARQGFLNGFRLGFLLAQELADSGRQEGACRRY